MVERIKTSSDEAMQSLLIEKINESDRVKLSVAKWHDDGTLLIQLYDTNARRIIDIQLSEEGLSALADFVNAIKS